MPLNLFICHWNKNVVILTKFSSLAALEVVILTTSSAASDEHFIKMKTFPFQWYSTRFWHLFMGRTSRGYMKLLGCISHAIILCLQADLCIHAPLNNDYAPQYYLFYWQLIVNKTASTKFNKIRQNVHSIFINEIAFEMLSLPIMNKHIYNSYYSINLVLHTVLLQQLSHIYSIERTCCQ